MHQNVSVSSDRGCEMGVEISCQAVMVELLNVKISTTKICSLVHAPCRHYSHKFVEERVALSVQLVQTFSQLLG